MKVAITGGTGHRGRLLREALDERGDASVVVSRTPEGPDQIGWDPVEPGSLELPEDVDAVVHLAGAPIFDRRWDEAYKLEILRSRAEGTRTVVQAVRDHGGIDAMVSASAVGYYGDRGDEELTEDAPPGDDFFADVCQAWEAPARELEEDEDVAPAVARVRTSVVLDGDEGALQTMLNPFGPVKPYHWGIGGPVGRGRQWFPWMHAEDDARAILHVLDHELEGPVNLAAPQQVRNKGFTKALGSVLNRPTVLPVPRFALRLMFGEVANVLFASQRVVPARLEETGFSWRFPTIGEALEDLLGAPEAPA